MSDNLIEKQLKGRWRTRYLINNKGEIIEKECRSCRITKTLSDFYPKSDCLGGKRPICNDCELKANRNYHRNDKPKSAARKRKWRKGSWQKSRDTIRAWYKANKDSINEKRRLVGSEYSRRRRERLESLENTWTIAEREQTLMYFGGCALTGSSIDVQFDHVIPVVTGKGGTVSWNMLPITAELNASKSTKNIVEWFYEVQGRYNLSEEKFIVALNYLSELAKMNTEDYIDYIYQCHENENGRNING